MQTLLRETYQCYSCGDWFTLADLEAWIVKEVVKRYDKRNHNISYLIRTGKKVRKLVCFSCMDFLSDEFGYPLN